MEENKKTPVLGKKTEFGLTSGNRALIVTGFHRSATSVTANYLLNSGLNMGANLIGGNISNAKGHFEDLEIVALHDEQLVLSETCWQFHDEVQLAAQDQFLKTYVSKRFGVSQHWGVKDPRTCLFLNEWKQTLGRKGCFLFVVRHWSCCIESLLHRHSRDLAYGLTEVSRQMPGVQFWVQPELAAKMWLSYNKRLLEFAKENPQITIMLTQRALFEGAPIISELNAKFGLNLNENIDSPFEPSLFRDKSNKRIFSQLSCTLKAQLNSVWKELLSLATFRSDDEEPHIVHDEVAVGDLARVKTLVSSKIEITPLNQHTLDEKSLWLEGCLKITDPTAMVQFLDSSSLRLLSKIQVSLWLPKIQEQFALDGHVLLASAKLLQHLQEYRLAIDYFQASISLGVHYPYVDMMMAQCWQALEQYQRSEFFFQKSIKGNPNNPLFYTNYAKLLIELNRDSEAERQFELGYQKGSKQPICIVPYCDFLDKKGKGKQAIDIANAFLDETKHLAIQRLLTRLSLRNNVEQGKKYYFDSIKGELATQDKYNWLAHSCKVIDCASAEEDFMIRCLSHWKKLL
ncbi:tetratricopeptide repeat protein [Vibrio parahaemolyticus]|nr:tetratricopeptide repeat protein [Vibrio parahaemolyticus]